MKRISKLLVLLIILNAIIYHSWMSFSVFTFSDWAYHFKEALSDFLIPSVWNSTWTSGFGYVDILLWKLPIYLLTGLIGRAGYGYNVAEKFIVFWPIVFGASIGSFLFVRHIIKSESAAFIGSLIFSLNTYFLSIDTQGHQFLTAGFAFSTFAILSFIKLVEEQSVRFAVLTALLLFLVGVYDLRSLYITFGILFFYLTYFTFLNFRRSIKSLSKIWLLSGVSIVIFVLSSSYWLFPLLSVQALTNNATLGRQIFGNEFYNIQSSITTFFPFWTGKETAWFTLQNVPVYFWMYPLLAIAGLIVSRKNKNVLFFAAIALIGIFFSKQADIPFPDLYNWLYTHLPGFSAFREASKFDFMTSLGYSVLIAAFVKWVIESKRKHPDYLTKYIPIAAIASVALWNGIPLFTTQVKSLFVRHTIPPEYVTLNKLIMEQPNYFRTYWINMSAAWQIYDNNHPQIDGNLISNSDWSDIYRSEVKIKSRSEGEKEMLFLKSQAMEELLDIASVKYIIVPLADPELGHDITNYFGKNHEYYRRQLVGISYLEKTNFDSSRILVYENKNYKPHIYVTYKKESIEKTISYSSVKTTMVSPSEYRAELKGITAPLYLNFSENYHPSWEIILGKVSWFSIFTRPSRYGTAVKHEKNVAGFNEFFIDPESLCNTNQNCTKNADNTYDINLSVYFAPQSQLYWGILISSLTLFSAGLYLLFYAISKKFSR